MNTSITKKYILCKPNKEVIEEFESMEELIFYVRDKLDYYIDYVIEEKTIIRNWY